MPCVKGTITPKKQIILPVVWFNPMLTTIASVPGGVKIRPSKNGGISTTVGGLVDTGATGSCITQGVAQSIKSNPDGNEPVTGVHGTKIVNTYTVGLFIPQIKFLLPGLKVTEVDNLGGNAESILGMDILLQGTFQLDFQGNFIFCV